MKNKSQMDVSDRLLSYVSGCLGVAGMLRDDRAETALSEQLLKSSVASYFRHGEAEGSPTAREFADKFKDTLKELRASRRALYLIKHYTDKAGISGMRTPSKILPDLIEESDELIRIFFNSIRTLEAKIS